MGFIVRRITEHDAARLEYVRLAALADAPSAFASTYEVEAALASEQWEQRARSGASGEKQATFLAEDEEHVIGIVGAYRDSELDACVELVSMWVAPDHRRRGVGSILVDAVLGWARDARVESVALWVTRGNTGAAELYRSLGFEETADHKARPSDPCKDERRMILYVGTDA